MVATMTQQDTESAPVLITKKQAAEILSCSVRTTRPNDHQPQMEDG